MKLGMLKESENFDFVYENEFAIETTNYGERLILTTKHDYINLAVDLIKNVSEEFWILYILLISRVENKRGRYQTTQPLSYNQLNSFCSTYGEYLETDGRHHLWLGSTKTNELIVYDHHNILYVYGNIPAHIQKLQEKDYKHVDEIQFPRTHYHCYNKNNDTTEIEIIKKNKWRYFSL